MRDGHLAAFAVLTNYLTEGSIPSLSILLIRIYKTMKVFLTIEITLKEDADPADFVNEFIYDVTQKDITHMEYHSMKFEPALEKRE